ARDVADRAVEALPVLLEHDLAQHRLARRARGARAAGDGFRPPGETLGHRLGAERPLVDVALHMAAAVQADEVELVERLDAFRGGVHAERLREAGDRGDDRAVATASLGRAADEALVDLDLVERRLLQIAERRIAGAEVVEREAHADT